MILALLSSLLLALSAETFVPASDARIGYEGRFTAPSDADPVARFDWPCSTITLSVVRTAGGGAATISALLTGGGSRFLATLTEDSTQRVIARVQLNSTARQAANVTVAALGAAEPAAAATLRLRKLSEASEDGHVPPALAQATASFGGFTLAGGGLAPAAAAPAPPARKIEFFGASDTAGFGVDGFPDPGTATCLLHMVRYESCDEAYSARLAAALGAEAHVQAWAGKGLLRNADQLIPAAFGAPLPTYFNRTLATDGGAATAWDWGRWLPDVVVVSLGGNDFNNAVKPTQHEFERGYHAMLDSLFGAYDRAMQQQQQQQQQQQRGQGQSQSQSQSLPVVVSICGGGSPSDPSRNRACPFVNASVASYAWAGASAGGGKGKTAAMARALYVEVPVGVVPDGVSGCLGHHNRKGSQMVADYLEPRLREIMGW